MIQFVLGVRPEFEQAFSQLNKEKRRELYSLVVKATMSIEGAQDNTRDLTYEDDYDRRECSIVISGIVTLDDESYGFVSQMFANALANLGIDRFFHIKRSTIRAEAFDKLLAPQKRVEINHNSILIELFAPDHEVPEDFVCPITKDIMHNPAYLETNKKKVNYEYSALCRWINEHQTDPTTRAPISSIGIINNLELARKISRHCVSLVLDKRSDLDNDSKKDPNAEPVASASLADIFTQSKLGSEYKDLIEAKHKLAAKALRRFAHQGNLKMVIGTLTSFPKIIDLPDENPCSGKTALHHAVEKGHKDVEEYLLGQGASDTIEDANGETAQSLRTQALSR